MIEYKCLLWIFIPCLIISLIISYTEIKRHYKFEAEMRRTNDMCIVHTSCLSMLGIISVIISITSAVMLVLIGLYYFGLLKV